MRIIVLLNPKRPDGYPKIKYTAIRNCVKFKVNIHDPNFDKPFESLTKIY